jgi:hypothetical protein
MRHGRRRCADASGVAEALSFYRTKGICGLCANRQVLLKNAEGTLPLERGTKVLLTGPHATTTQDLGGKCVETWFSTAILRIAPFGSPELLIHRKLL